MLHGCKNKNEDYVTGITTAIEFLETRELELELEIHSTQAIETIYELIEKRVEREDFWTRPNIAWPQMNLPSSKTIHLNAGDSYFFALTEIADALECEVVAGKEELFFLPKNARKDELKERFREWDDHSPFSGLIFLEFSGVYDVFPPEEVFTSFLEAKLKQSKNYTQLELPTQVEWKNTDSALRNIAGTRTVTLVGDWSYEYFVITIAYYYSQFWTVDDGKLIFSETSLPYSPPENLPKKKADEHDPFL